MKRVPKKNISRRIADLKLPGVSPRTDQTEAAQTLPQRISENVAPPSEPRVSLPAPIELGPRPVLPVRKFVFIFLGLAVLIGGLTGTYFYKRQESLLNSLKADTNNLHLALGNATGTAAGNSPSASDFFKNFWPTLSGAGQTYRDLQATSQSLTTLVASAADLRANWLSLAVNHRGDELIAKLKTIQAELATLDDSSARLLAINNNLGQLAPLDPATYLGLHVELTRARSFLDSFLPWFELPTPHQIVIFLENPSELRPGGGFLGSYAVATITHGNLSELTVHDINQADREVATKIIPPKPLQLITTNWRAADANWFFDFADSASTTLRFLESSKLYISSSTTFDGAIGVSARIVGDILGLTGAVTLPSGMTVASSTFLTQIQNEVQAGQVAKASQPKVILSEIAPILLQKLTALAPGAVQALTDKAADWFLARDVRFYFKDPTFQNFLSAYNLTGQIAPLPENFNGDYFALTAANVGGGKTDIFMDQKVGLQAQVNLDGTVTAHLILTRKHNGNTRSEWWYRVPNQVYVQIWTPRTTTLVNETGGIAKTIAAPINYGANGYVSEPAIAAVLKTQKDYLGYPNVNSFEEYGRSFFAAWLKTAVGATSTLTLDYSHRLVTAPAGGVQYQFIFDKQSGGTGSYGFQLNAPVGFIWKENGLPVFEYTSNDIPGRYVITLTLEQVRN